MCRAWAAGLAAIGLALAGAAVADELPLWARVAAAPPLSKPDASGFVDHDGARVYYAVFHKGGGRPVVLLHGGLQSSESWGFEAPRLARRHEVIVTDFRGQGRSSGPPPVSYGQMAGDVLAVMDVLRVPKASIVGSSDGAIVGLILAIGHPQRIERLFAWGANFDIHAAPEGPPDPVFRDAGPRFMAQAEAEYRRLSPSPEGFPALRKALSALYAREPDLTPADLGRIRAPTVIADGDHEQFISRAHTEALARAIPRARLVILSNVSHGGPVQDPEAFHRAVESLLDPR